MALVTQSGFLGELHKKLNELKMDNIALQNRGDRLQTLYSRTKEAYEYVAHIADDAGLMKAEHHARLKKILVGDDVKEAE